MTVDEASTAFRGLTTDQQIRFLVIYAADLTVTARGTYVVGSKDVADPHRLRFLNEVQHRLLGHARNLLFDAERYPDDVIVRIIVGENDIELLRSFEMALKKAGMPCS